MRSFNAEALLSIFPPALRKSPDYWQLAQVIAPELEAAYQAAVQCEVLCRVDELPENVLDALASFAGAGYTEIVPVSAATGRGMEELKRTILSGLPEGPRYFPADMLTDQPERDLCAEIIREKALIHLKDEVPHGIGVEMMSFVVKSEHLTEIHATIYCEKAGHKGIIIGKGGSMLKLIGAEARRDIERLLDTKVNLQLWVKVREDWRNRVSDLRTLGYDA